MSDVTVRPASKAGGWYNANPKGLGKELETYVGDVDTPENESGLPITGARIVISPHAGYEHSGPCAAYSFKYLDLRNVKRVFILGPSHTYYIRGCAVTTYGEWATPFGNFTVDKTTLAKVQEAGDMADIPEENDWKEHSMEMQMPYLWYRCQQTFQTTEDFPLIVPILVGDNDRAEAQAVGRVLVPYLEDPENAFIISSDFCHWGRHFDYMPYSADNDPAKLTHLRPFGPVPKGPPIHETIEAIDRHAMNAVESGSHKAFLDSLRLTRNSVCGRHPIGVAMAAMEMLGDETARPRFKVIAYRRSEKHVRRPDQSSVSYVAAYAVLN